MDPPYPSHPPHAQLPVGFEALDARRFPWGVPVLRPYCWYAETAYRLEPQPMPVSATRTTLFSGCCAL